MAQAVLSVAKSDSVMIGVEGFNALPDVTDGWKVLLSMDYRRKLNETIGQAIVNNKLEGAFCAVLNHMHYPLLEGERQVTGLPTIVQAKKDGIWVSEWIAQPSDTHSNDDLIPIKWRLNEKLNKFESYEYITSKIDKNGDLKGKSKEFESNLILQKELINAIMTSGLAKYIGIMLNHRPIESHAIELNNIKGRQSTTVVFEADEPISFEKNEYYQQLMKNKDKLIETSWVFEAIPESKTGINKADSCGICYCKHCGSHCYSHK